MTLRLPLWRQVSLWNDGIDVSRKAIVSALGAGDNVLVAMDGKRARIDPAHPELWRPSPQFVSHPLQASLACLWHSATPGRRPSS